VIFVSVGTVLPFDRLIRAMDAWAAAHPEEEAVAQIGRGSFEPAHMRWSRTLGWEAYDGTVAAARLMVAHAGTGSVLTASEWAKPIVLLPRRARLGEHRSDHQIETAAWLRGRPCSWPKPRRSCPRASPKPGLPKAASSPSAPTLPRPCWRSCGISSRDRPGGVGRAAHRLIRLPMDQRVSGKRTASARTCGQIADIVRY